MNQWLIVMIVKEAIFLLPPSKKNWYGTERIFVVLNRCNLIQVRIIELQIHLRFQNVHLSFSFDILRICKKKQNYYSQLVKLNNEIIMICCVRYVQAFCNFWYISYAYPFRMILKHCSNVENRLKWKQKLGISRMQAILYKWRHTILI